MSRPTPRTSSPARLSPSGALAVVMPLAEQRGGAELMFLHLARAHVAQGAAPFRVAFLDDGPLVAELRELGYDPKVFAAGRLREPASYARTVRALRGWLCEAPTAAVLSWMTKAHLYAGPAAAAARVPALWFQHGVTSGHWTDRLATAVPARGVLCCSRAAQDAQRELRPRRPTAVVNPSVDLATFDARALPSPAESRRRVGCTHGGPLVVTVARLQTGKGLHVLVDAAAAVVGREPGARFVVVGGRDPMDPGYPERLARQAADAGLGSTVSFVGHQAQAEVALWMQAADCVACPSVDPEGFGMVVVEALALGKPVVAPDAGGPRDTLSGGAGWLVPPGDPGALATAVVDALRERPGARAARAAERARSFAAATLPQRLGDAAGRLLAPPDASPKGNPRPRLGLAA